MKEKLNNLRLNSKEQSSDSKFETNIAVVNMHPSKGTHWFAYKNESLFVSYGSPPPNSLTSHINKRNKMCVCRNRNSRQC